ncbi:MAG: mechanosensitive ion channel family protein [Thermodesulfobacteriota bacterium]
MEKWLTEQLLALGLSQGVSVFLATTAIISVVLLIAAAATIFVQKVILRIITQWIQSNRLQWDNALVKHRFLTIFTWYVPVLIFSMAIDSFFSPGSSTAILSKRIVMALFVLVTVLSFNALISAVNDIYLHIRSKKGTTIQGYIDAVKIVTWVIGLIFIASIFTGKSPWGIFSILGGLTAVTMLVFKDTILGFVASIQLTATDMVRVGDWIEMPQYGADGDVIQLSINTVRVRNWDKTVTTIPTYALVSSSFKNWRGMSESGGRRIKRSLLIDTGSIRFCDEAMLERFSQIELLQDYLFDKEKELLEYNSRRGIDTDVVVNGRRQTNIGVFRAYIESYLRVHPEVHRDMTFLVRQLPPGEHGLPLEIYVFSKDQVWANYEAIQADIFDHLFAAAPWFDLRIFQNPSSYDLRLLSGVLRADTTKVECQ